MEERDSSGRFAQGHRAYKAGGRKSRAQELREWSLEQEQPSTECEVRERFRILNEAWGLFRVRLSQECFPDFVLETANGGTIKAEVELASRNFGIHGHDANQCDLVICWIHNWLECPITVMPIEQMWWAWQQIGRLTKFGDDRNKTVGIP